MIRELLVCKCGDVSHQLVFSEDDSGNVIVSVHLTSFPFWKRLWNGLKYILGHKSQYGDFEEAILDKSHVACLESVVKAIKS